MWRHVTWNSVVCSPCCKQAQAAHFTITLLFCRMITHISRLERSCHPKTMPWDTILNTAATKAFLPFPVNCDPEQQLNAYLPPVRFELPILHPSKHFCQVRDRQRPPAQRQLTRKRQSERPEHMPPGMEGNQDNGTLSRETALA